MWINIAQHGSLFLIKHKQLYVQKENYYIMISKSRHVLFLPAFVLREREREERGERERERERERFLILRSSSRKWESS